MKIDLQEIDMDPLEKKTGPTRKYFGPTRKCFEPTREQTDEGTRPTSPMAVGEDSFLTRLSYACLLRCLICKVYFIKLL